MEGVGSSKGVCTNKLLKSQRLMMLVSCFGMQRAGYFAGWSLPSGLRSIWFVPEGLSTTSESPGAELPGKCSSPLGFPRRRSAPTATRGLHFPRCFALRGGGGLPWRRAPGRAGGGGSGRPCARGRGRASVRPGPGHVRVRTPPPPPPPQPRPGPPPIMGSILSRRIAGVEDIDIQANSAYRYPPKSGEWPPRLQPWPRPGLLPRARTARRAGWSAWAAGSGQRGLAAGPAAEGGLGALLSPAALPAASLSGAPRDLHPDPGARVGPALTAAARPGDLGSVSSPLRAARSHGCTPGRHSIGNLPKDQVRFWGAQLARTTPCPALCLRLQSGH